MSQSQLADACDIGQTAVCAIEKGRCHPSWATLGLMSAALGMPMSHVVAAWESDAARAPRHEDVDNLGKLVMDALNNLAWPDDRNVSRADLWKLEDEHNPRTVIRLRVMPE